MSSFSSDHGRDKSLQMLCSRRAERTYEVTIANLTESHDLEYTSNFMESWPSSEETNFLSQSELRWPPRRVENLQATPGPSTSRQTPLSLRSGNAAGQGTQHKHGQVMQQRRGPATQHRHGHVPPKPYLHFDASRGQYRSKRPEKMYREDTIHAQAAPIKTVRQKLIEFLQTDEFFDEYSFMALMALLFAHMFRFGAAILAMGCNAPAVIGVFVSVWRFMNRKVEDILETTGGVQVGLKCAIFTAELLVIFVCIFFFLWTLFIPVCNLLAAIVSKVLYLFT